MEPEDAANRRGNASHNDTSQPHTGAPEVAASDSITTPSGRVLPAAFFQRETEQVTRELMGKLLCSRQPDGSVRCEPLTELEAYLGPHDLACHSSRGKTARTSVMFEPGGVIYMYLCYGIHWMLNFVTADVNYPAAVLVRGVGKVRGPGRVTKQWGLGRGLNKQLLTPQTGLWVEDSGIEILDTQIERSPRVGIDYAGEYWASQPLRFVLR